MGSDISPRQTSIPVEAGRGRRRKFSGLNELQAAQLADSLKAMPNGIKLGTGKQNNKGFSDLPLFENPNQQTLF